ncbi:MAG: ABC transporter permease [Bacilli bacterium]|nr:ABC transporter permease [Bacilli bacterium]
MNKLKFLIKTSLKKKFSSKWFIGINILLLLLVPAIINIDRIIKYFGGDFNETTKIYVVDEIGMYNSFESLISENSNIINTDIKINKYDKDKKIIENKIKEKEKKDIIITFEVNDENKIISKIISYEYIDTILYQTLVNALNNSKVNYSLQNSNIDKEELAKIYENVEIERVFLSEELDENEETLTMIGNILIPIFIIPVFLLVVMVVNMIGAEINEEKTSKSMEIIISSVSPTVHFFSKVISTNIFILSQGAIILFSGFLGMMIRGGMSEITSLVSSIGIDSTSFLNTFVSSGIFSNILKAIPFVIIMMVLTFVAYSLLAGIFASMTTSMEDYQQLQTPLMLIMLFAYYIALISSMYDNSIFIKIVSFIPFVSGILSPVLLILGQISYIDIIISTVILLITNFLLIKYGLKIYKVGILNYSSTKLWEKMLKAIKEK